MIKLVLLRHGESVWNKENRFTGWTDVDLTEKGVEEAKEAGKLLNKKGYIFDIAFTNVLKRCTDTLKIALKELNQENILVIKSWRLNERHYGALQGLNKSETAAKYGEKQVLLWRRSYDTKPPALTKKDDRWAGKDPLYKNLKTENIPTSESLKDTIQRLTPFWNESIVPRLKEGKKVFISASGNSSRAIVKILDNVPNDKIVLLNIPTGVPLVYELDDNLKPIKHYFLGDTKEIEKKMKAVAAQGKTK